MAFALLIVVGGLRYGFGRRIDAELQASRLPPFDLEDLPSTLGPWTGTAGQLDPEIARLTGSTGHILRSYTDRETGVALSVLVIYGPAIDIYGHTPEICYPSTGYGEVPGSNGERTLEVDGESARYRTLAYAREAAGLQDRQEVSYSWYIDGQWSPSLPGVRQIMRTPAMFKVQVARSMAPTEDLSVTGPCDDFLDLLIPEIDRRLADAAPGKEQG